MITLFFQYLHKMIVTNIVYFLFIWVNALPVKNGVSNKHSPLVIVVHTNMIWKKHFKVVLGAYCEIHNETGPSNSMVPCTHQAIALGPTSNLQVTHKLLCLNTGNVLKRRNFTEYPIPDRVINRVNKWVNKMSQELYGICL